MDLDQTPLEQLLKNSSIVDANSKTLTNRLVSDEKRLDFSLILGEKYSEIKAAEKISEFGGVEIINCVCVSSFSEFFLSGDQNGAVTLRYLNSNQAQVIFEERNSSIKSIALSQDDLKLIVGIKSRIIILDFPQCTEEFTLSGHLDTVNSVTISSDSKFVVSGSDDSTVKVWDMESKLEAFALSGHSASVRSVCISRNSQYIISGSSDFSVKVWNFDTRSEECSFVGHSSRVNSVSISHHSEFVVSGSDDSLIKVWSLSTRAEEFTLKGHTFPVYSVAISSNSKFLISGSGDNNIKLWDLDSRREEQSLNRHSAPIYAVAISNNNEFVITGSADKTIKKWSFRRPEKETTLKGHSAALFSVAISPDRQHIVTGSEDLTIKVWNLYSLKEEFTLSGHTSFVESLSISSDCKFIVSGSADKTVVVWNWNSRSQEQVFKGHTSAVFAVAITKNCEFVVSGSMDLSIKVWSLSNGSELFTLLGHFGGITTVAVSNDMQFIFSGSRDRSIKAWNFTTQREEFSLLGHTSVVLSIAVSDDDKILVSGSDDHSIKMWDLKERFEKCTLNGHLFAVYSVAISPDSKFIASGSWDKTVKIWSVFERREEFTLKGHSSTVFSVSISNDSQFVVSGSFDYTCKIWDLSRRKEKLEIPRDLYLPVSISNDSKFVVSLCNNFVKIKDLHGESMEEFPKSLCGETSSLESLNKSTAIRNISGQGSFRNLSACWLELNQYILRKNIRVTEEWLFENILFYPTSVVGPQYLLDCFFQDQTLFADAIEAIKANKFSNLNPKTLDFYFTEFLYTLFHFWAYKGEIDLFAKYFTSKCCLKADVFGNSPLYYSISKKHQKVTDFILDYLNNIQDISSKQFLISIHAIRNNFSLIIKNSSKNLPAFLNKIFLNGPYINVPQGVEFPIFLFSNLSRPTISEFFGVDELNVHTETTPAIYKNTVFRIPSIAYSLKTVEFLESMLQCKNNQIFKCKLIQFIIDYQWEQVKLIAEINSFALFADLALFVIMLDTGTSNIVILSLFIFVNLFLQTWETVQIFTSSLYEYFSDPFNCIDSSLLVHGLH